MFETSDSELITFMGEEAREEAAAVGRRLALVGELYARRHPELEVLDLHCADAVAAVAAEISPVHNISHARAVSQIHTAITLRHRLPRVAQELRSGVIDYRMVATIIARTENVDDVVIGELDEAIAQHAMKWMKLSTPKLRDRIDQWVTKFDPAGVRVTPQVEQSRYLEVEPTQVGMAGVSGNIRAEDGAALTQRLDALAATVCEKDPRTTSQRRADACGPLGRGEATLACRCGSDDCPAAAERAASATAIIHVLAEQSTLDGSSDNPGYLPGFGILPAESVRALATTATLTPVALPAPDAATEPGYRPSAGLADFVRWRDLTCRWPGCDRPVMKSDIDHTRAWPYGPTHPSNTKCYCRIHHLVKTFCPGFDDYQLPNGDLVLSTPSGHSYRREPHGATLFPALCRNTGTLDLPDPPPPSGTDRCAMSPKRRQTREQDRRDRITTERQQRAQIIAEAQRERADLKRNTDPPPPQNNDPPPF
ncbi:HNH endonuclease signature motif containing protein [Mycobacterium deserti]|uniref:HNH endonuclease n=1 Tax=Mycobacterium deserti TaxID=2978347 RepID=A0ABT2MDA8_9MYCO|nr:HNH endonuclease signature motif containing protein [Mycobacterium deserti]MCT7660253.1 HNH endonuclease [Mycobacterium deserti]